MGLFSASELLAAADDVGKLGTRGIGYSPRLALARTESQKAIRETVGKLAMGHSLFFMTDGAWSNIQLLEHLLAITGPASVFFTTWSISADALTRFDAWKCNGSITSLHAILDQGIRNRKPAIYQQAVAVLSQLRIIKCHAKVTVIRNTEWAITLLGSANYTRNPRRETGVIACDAALADGNIEWILEVFNDG